MKYQIVCILFVYKIPYRRARAWPSARASKGILHTSILYSRLFSEIHFATQICELCISSLACLRILLNRFSKKCHSTFIDTRCNPFSLCVLRGRLQRTPAKSRIFKPPPPRLSGCVRISKTTPFPDVRIFQQLFLHIIFAHYFYTLFLHIIFTHYFYTLFLHIIFSSYYFYTLFSFIY